jgi:hypothetical protein
MPTLIFTVRSRFWSAVIHLRFLSFSRFTGCHAALLGTDKFTNKEKAAMNRRTPNAR